MKGRKWKRKGIIEKRRIFSFPIPFRLFEFWKKVPLGLYSEKKSRVLEREGSENSWVEKTFSTGKFSISKSVFYFRRCIHFSPACSEDGGGKKKKKEKKERIQRTDERVEQRCPRWISLPSYPVKFVYFSHRIQKFFEMNRMAMDTMDESKIMGELSWNSRDKRKKFFEGRGKIYHYSNFYRRKESFVEEYLITIRFKKKSSSNLSNLNIEKKGNLFFILYSLISYVIICNCD